MTVAATKRRRANAVIGLSLVSVIVAAALLALFWTPHNPVAINLRERLHPPSAAYWLGTDEFGRDVLSRIMAGASVSVSIAVLTAIIANVSGIAVGVFTGYLRGWTDRSIMAVNDALLAFPGILLALAVVVVLGPGRGAIIVALSIAYMPVVTRLVRGTVLSVRQRDYVAASWLAGNGEVYTMIRHVLPNCIAPITVLATTMVGWALLAESALSFLGLGVPPPAPSWGNMLAGGRPYFQIAIWLEIAPGLCFALTLLGVNLLGDALRDRMDPRSAAD